MTLAAAYRIGQVPALLSDFLVTGQSRGEHLPIPSRVEIDTPLPLEWMVTVNGLTRKSIVICKNVAVAVAGNGLGASAVCQTLTKRLQNIEPDSQALAAVLSNVDDALSSATQCTLVGWLIEKGVPRSFRWRSGNPQTVEWDDDFIEGSGSGLFRRIAWRPDQRTWTVIHNFDHAQHYGLQQITSLLLNEITNGIPIQHLFGGGYDLLLWDGSRFRQAADVTFLFLALDWLRKAEKAENDPGPILFRQAEFEDCMVIRAIIGENLLGALPGKDERSAIIAPITSLGRRHQLNTNRHPSEVRHFADRIYVAISGIGAAGTQEHWSAGVQGHEAAQFELEFDPGAENIRFLLPINIVNNMWQAAEQQFSRVKNPQRR